jgi:rhodanese-related sulfurtransferase
MNITVLDLKDYINRKLPIHIIDVREELEFHTFNIGGENIPLGRLLGEPDEFDFDKEDEIIVLCQRGLRSETARRFLVSLGYENVKNLQGGLLAWRKAGF